MSLLDHLGTVTPVASSDCGVCDWYASLAPGDRRTFDQVVDSGASKAELWLKCSTFPGNPLQRKLTRFKECLGTHDRKAAVR